MKAISTYFSLAVLLIFSACKQDYVEPATASQQVNQDVQKNKNCPEYVSYYGSTPMSLGTAHTDRILVGFEKNVPAHVKAQILGNYNFVFSVASYHQNEVSDFVIVNLKNGRKCYDVEAALEELRTNNKILYANPFLQIGQDPNGMVVSITDQFIVSVKEDASPTFMQDQAALTNTQIVMDLGFGSYLLATTRQTNGSALDMANYFNTLSEVEYGETDFYYQLSM